MGSTTIELCASCCDPCAAYPDSFNVTLAGFDSCGCIETASSQNAANLIGVNGAFSGVDKVTDFWRKDFGTFDILVYEESDTTCSGETVSTSTAYCSIFIGCQESGQLTISVRAGIGGYVTDFSDGFQIFATVIDLAAAEFIDCSTTLYIGGGTVLIEIP